MRPRPLEAREVRFKVKPGVRFHIDEVSFTGLTIMNAKDARRFFRSDTTLLMNTRTNAFSPSRVARAADALLAELRQRGYAASEVRTSTRLDERTGKVTVYVDVSEGARWRITERAIERARERQRALLAAAATLIRPKGILIYATCSLEPEENALVVDALLALRPELRRAPVAGAVPAELLTAAGDLEVLPQRHGIDGAYAARLERAS